jgi:ubiquinone/menaquinone biosynthesis C-methylase UbiE
MTASITPASSRSHSSIPPSSPSGVPSSNSSTYSVRVDESTQEVVFTGILRPFTAEQMGPVRSSLEKAAWSAATRGNWTLGLNFKRLKHMSNVAFLELNRFVKWAAEELPELKLKLVISSVVPWAIRKFQIMADLYPGVSLEIYDRAFYPSQPVLEDDGFTVVLLTQSKILWEHEKELLHRHGLRPGMRIADIGCGLGDFAILIHPDFKPQYLVGVDHARPALKYAQERARDLGIETVEYQYGDAAALLLPDNSFDFVSCRLSLQVFNRPYRILQELFRICKPGGRVYVTNEYVSGISGYPRQESIKLAYQRLIEICRMVGMDFDTGIKTREMLNATDLEDIKVNLLDVNNMNTDPDDFAKVVESWIYFAAQTAATAGADPSILEEIKAGFIDHMAAIKSRTGYGTWQLYAGSGRKPFRES